jgi:predicted phage terminase large subunit-like protein
MTTLQTLEGLSIRLQEKNDIGVCEGLLNACIIYREEEGGNATPYIKNLLQISASELRIIGNPDFFRYLDLRKRGLHFDARTSFDSYLQYIEFDAPPHRKFYLPRRGYLIRHGIIDACQDIIDKKIRLFVLCMPKRAGKSQILINLVCMMSGINPSGSTLMEGIGDDLVDSFYKGCLEYLQPPNEYNFIDIFPESKFVHTLADKKTIDLEQKKRFSTIQTRSVGAKQVGLTEATNILGLDDLIDGRKEARNRAILEERWIEVSGDVMGRALEGTPIMAVGTRYSIHDPLGKLIDFAIQEGWAHKVIAPPALNEDGESNYEYKRPKADGTVAPTFSTSFFVEQKSLLTEEQFESEFQQQPFEAKGLMFPESRLNRFFPYYVCDACKNTIHFLKTHCEKCECTDKTLVIVPDTDPDAIISVVDTAEKGSDSVAMLIAYLYGSDVFIVDVVFNNSPPEITKPQCAKKIINHKVSVATFESNNAGEYYARDVGEMVEKEGGYVSIRTKRTISNKHTRIEMASDGIILRFFFLDKTMYERGSQYWMFMRELVQYTRTGKVEHDDAPDVCSLLENELRIEPQPEVSYFRRPF